MKLIKFDEMKKTWFEISKSSDGNVDPTFELEVHKKLLNIFQVGDYYYYILNIPKLEMEYISDSTAEILKLKDKNLFSAQYIFENMHPDDTRSFLLNERKVTEFFSKLTPEKVLKYKVSYDYRIKKADGTYIWVLMQTTTIQTDENGAVIRVMGVQTDISHLKTSNQISGLSFIGLDGEPSYYNVDVEDPFLLPSQELFTGREKEIMKLIIEGFTTQEIAVKLSRSVHTINTHRKNIFQKTESKTIADLVANCLKNNWI